MLITVKAGTTIEGHKFSETTNFNVAEVKALKLLAEGKAERPRFDERGRCEINTNFEAYQNNHGTIEIQSGGDLVTVLPAGFPLEHLPAALGAFHDGHAKGAYYGRLKLQGEFRALLDAEKSAA